MPNAEAQLAQNQEITMRISQQDAYRPLQRVSAGLTRCSRWNIQRPQNDIGCRKKKQRTPDPFQPLRTFDTTSTSFIHDLSLDLATFRDTTARIASGPYIPYQRNGTVLPQVSLTRAASPC